jgi:hypothetical protein
MAGQGPAAGISAYFPVIGFTFMSGYQATIASCRFFKRQKSNAQQSD